MKASLKELLIHILGVDFRYPVGSYYETSNANFDPNTAWGGTWVQDSKGRVIVAYDSTQTEFNSIGKTGGGKTVTLDVTQIPSHNHTYTQPSGDDKTVSSGTPYWFQANPTSKNFTTQNTGGGKAHNNLQPYTVAYRWHRTA